MGSSGTKKNRKGKKPTHLAKVGTPRANNAERHRAEQDVVGNFGIHGRGWVFWTSIVILVAIVVFGLLSWIFWF